MSKSVERQWGYLKSYCDLDSVFHKFSQRMCMDLTTLSILFVKWHDNKIRNLLFIYVTWLFLRSSNTKQYKFNLKFLNRLFLPQRIATSEAFDIYIIFPHDSSKTLDNKEIWNRTYRNFKFVHNDLSAFVKVYVRACKLFCVRTYHVPYVRSEILQDGAKLALFLGYVLTVKIIIAHASPRKIMRKHLARILISVIQKVAFP
jgi:hypothetical protein